MGDCIAATSALARLFKESRDAVPAIGLDRSVYAALIGQGRVAFCERADPARNSLEVDPRTGEH